MDGAAKKVRVIRYHEITTRKNGKTEENWMWLATTDETCAVLFRLLLPAFLRFGDTPLDNSHIKR